MYPRFLIPLPCSLMGSNVTCVIVYKVFEIEFYDYFELDSVLVQSCGYVVIKVDTSLVANDPFMPYQL